MDEDPLVKPIRDMHAADLGTARDKLFEFLSGWTGGPGLYIAKYGHPRLRRRHMHVSIGAEEAEQWMHCMRAALAECVSDDSLRRDLEAQFTRVANHMRNRA